MDMDLCDRTSFLTKYISTAARHDFIPIRGETTGVDTEVVHKPSAKPTRVRGVT